MSGAVKKSTLLAGLAVAKEPHYVLNRAYNKILRLLNDFPKDYAYRVRTEELVKERAKIVNETKDLKLIEQRINNGQIEEVIIQAQNELNLVEQMSKWKPWEKLVEHPPPHQWSWPPHQ